MKFWTHVGLTVLAVGATIIPAGAQSTANPVAAALRGQLTQAEKNFSGSAEKMPAAKYGFKPTEGNMTFGAHMAHMGDFNETMCGLIAGTKAPGHAKVAATDAKEAIVAHLKRSFAFCSSTLASLDDAKLGENVSFYGSQITRAAAILILNGDWADHYAVTSTYLRLNDLLPPTARK